MRYVVLLIVLSLTGCEKAPEPKRTATPEQEACVSRVLDAEIARGLAKSEAALAESNAAIESGNLETMLDTDLVDEAISDRDSCLAYAACFTDADPVNRAMYLQQCTRDKMEERMLDWLQQRVPTDDACIEALLADREAADDVWTALHAGEISDLEAIIG